MVDVWNIGFFCFSYWEFEIVESWPWPPWP